MIVEWESVTDWLPNCGVAVICKLSTEIAGKDEYELYRLPSNGRWSKYGDLVTHWHYWCEKSDIVQFKTSTRTAGPVADLPQQKEPAMHIAPAVKQDTTTADRKIKSISYPGNKFASENYKKIINQLPPHDVFISGFLGTCAVLAMKRPAASNIGVDPALEEVQEFWSGLERRDIKLLRQDFFQFIQQFTWSKQMNQRILLYLDPPYEMNYRRSAKPCYTHELSPEDHAQLLKVIRRITETSNVMIALSHFPHPTYDELLHEGWRKVEYRFRTHRETVTDALYMNYPEPTELHEYTWIGEDKMERQRIKRRVQSFTGKLRKMPALERNAIIAAVQQLNTSTPPPLKISKI